MGEGSEEDKKYSLKLYSHSQSLHGGGGGGSEEDKKYSLKLYTHSQSLHGGGEWRRQEIQFKTVHSQSELAWPQRALCGSSALRWTSDSHELWNENTKPTLQLRVLSGNLNYKNTVLYLEEKAKTNKKSQIVNMGVRYCDVS